MGIESPLAGLLAILLILLLLGVFLLAIGKIIVWLSQGISTPEGAGSNRNTGTARHKNGRGLIIKNLSQAELGVMLEPSTVRKDIEPGGAVVIEGDFRDEDITIDFSDDSFLSVWCPLGSRMRKLT